MVQSTILLIPCSLKFWKLHPKHLYVKYVNVPSEIAKNIQYLLYWLHSKGYFITLLANKYVFLASGGITHVYTKVHTSTHSPLAPPPGHINMHIESKVDNVNQKLTTRRKVPNPDIQAWPKYSSVVKFDSTPTPYLLLCIASFYSLHPKPHLILPRA